jgi:hypothetical protein
VRYINAPFWSAKEPLAYGQIQQIVSRGAAREPTNLRSPKIEIVGMSIAPPSQRAGAEFMRSISSTRLSRVRLFDIVSNDEGPGNEFGANRMVLI